MTEGPDGVEAEPSLSREYRGQGLEPERQPAGHGGRHQGETVDLDGESGKRRGSRERFEGLPSGVRLTGFR